MGLWCDYQMLLSDGITVVCAAHPAEGRAIDCPYPSNEERLKSRYPCCEYKHKVVDMIETVRDRYRSGGSNGTIQTCGEM